MIEARNGHTATRLLDGRVLVAGGGSGGDGDGGPLASAELYDPGTESWTATGGMIEARGAHTATLLPDGTVLVVGGGGGGGLLASAELYDPSTGTWTATGRTIEARLGHTATLLTDGRVLVAGGYRVDVSGNFVNILASAELYNPGSGTWTVTANMIGVRIGHTATRLLDGRVLVAGGGSSGDGDGGPLASAELYDPGTESWTATGGMIEAGPGHRATLLADGRVLVAGRGSSGSSAELYDPSSGSWAATGNMVEGRFGPTATLLPDGKLLLVGGNSNSGLLASAELYDPSSGTWAATRGTVEARVGHTATLLLDGRVLVAGSYSSGDFDSSQASAELYDPGSGT
jgi:hypothetical protein